MLTGTGGSSMTGAPMQSCLSGSPSHMLPDAPCPSVGWGGRSGTFPSHRPAVPRVAVTGFITSCNASTLLERWSCPLVTRQRVPWCCPPWAGGHCRAPPTCRQAPTAAEGSECRWMGPGRGNAMQGPGCRQGRGQQGAQTPSREDGREPHCPIRLLTKHTLKDKMTKNLKTAITERKLRVGSVSE